MEVYPGITMDPGVRFGKPCIKVTKIDVATVLGRFAAGDKIEDIQELSTHPGSSYGCSRLRHPRSRASAHRRQIRMIILLDENFPLRFYTRNREINDKIEFEQPSDKCHAAPRL